MKKVVNAYDRLEQWFMILAMAVMAIVVFLQVVFRVTKGSLPWSEELSRYLTIWISCVGASYCFKHGVHVGVDAFKLLFPKKAQEFIALLSYVACVVICILIALFGLQVVIMQMEFGQLSPAMRIPMWTAYIAIPIGFAFSSLRNVGLIFQSVKKIRDNDFDAEPDSLGEV